MVRTKLHISNDLNNILFAWDYYLTFFVNFQQLLSLLSDKRFSFNIMGMNKWNWTKLHILKYFLLQTKLFVV